MLATQSELKRALLRGLVRAASTQAAVETAATRHPAALGLKPRNSRTPTVSSYADCLLDTTYYRELTRDMVATARSGRTDRCAQRPSRCAAKV
jgi:hypothetical protein